MTASRYCLIDYQHLAYKTMAAQPLSTTKIIDGQLQTIDTTIPSYTIKNVYNMGGRGMHWTGVFLEGGNGHRKNYFSRQAMPSGKNATNEYKGGRQSNNSAFYRGINLAINLMAQGQVSLYRQEGFEADDLIVSMVNIIKALDKETPIDIITGDSDLLALVDDQVSVYMKGNRQHAEPGCPERRLYFQVTPDTWDEYLGYTSAYGDYNIPYNSMLLFKMIRGDKTDNITGACTGFGKVNYSALMDEMLRDGVDFPNIFRYGLDFDTIMKPVLTNYFNDEIVLYMKYIYEGINPSYVNLQIPKQIDLGLLQASVINVDINLLK